MAGHESVAPHGGEQVDALSDAFRLRALVAQSFPGGALWLHDVKIIWILGLLSFVVCGNPGRLILSCFLCRKIRKIHTTLN